MKILRWINLRLGFIQISHCLHFSFMGHAKLKGHFREDQPSGGMKNAKEEKLLGVEILRHNQPVWEVYMDSSM